MNVHVLVTGNTRMSTLVFDTIRVGFPTFDIYVWDNNTGRPLNAVKEMPPFIGHYRHYEKQISHWDWIRHRVNDEKEPFIICDTDMIFFESVEEDIIKSPEAHVAGELQQFFYDPVLYCVHVPRFHTALMRINPKGLLELEQGVNKDIPSGAVLPVDLIKPQWMLGPQIVTLYADTMTLASAFLPCYTFSEEILKKYIHLYCGTWIEQIKDKVPKFYALLSQAHQEVLEDPKESAPLFRETINKFFTEHGSFSWKGQ